MDEVQDDNAVHEETPLFMHNPKIIANTKEKYMQLTIGNIVFRDSLKFNPTSMDKWIASMRKPLVEWKKTNLWLAFTTRAQAS